MHIDFLLNIFKINKKKTSIIWNNKEFSYSNLLDQIKDWELYLQQNVISRGKVVSVIGDFSPASISLLLALIANRNIIVPLTFYSKKDENKKSQIAGVEVQLSIDNNDKVSLSKPNFQINHEYYSKLNKEQVPGLVLFTSGTSGTPKAAVHNFSKLLKKR